MVKYCLIGIVVLIASIVPAYSCSSPRSSTVPNWTASSWADIQTCANSALNGDTIALPAGTYSASQLITITKALTIQGAGIGSTIVSDSDSAAEPLLRWVCVDGKSHRLTGFEFNDNGGSSAARFDLQCKSTANTTFRVDHNKFDDLAGEALAPQDMIGVIDHNTFHHTTAHGNDSIMIRFYDRHWHGNGNYGDQSWHDTVTWGGSEFLFVEDNTFTYDGAYGAITDGAFGQRIVFRHNTINHGWFEVHGSESGGRDRGGRAQEVYQNTYAWNGNGYQISNIRSGSGLIWGNAGTNALNNTAYASTWQVDRPNGVGVYGTADGNGPWDKNNPGNLAFSGTTASASGLTVTVQGTPFSPNALKGYEVKRTSGCTVTPSTPCAARISSNTTNQITFEAGFVVSSLSWTAGGGDSYAVNKLTNIFDQQGRAQGTLLSPAGCTPSIIASGGIGTATCTGINLNTGDWVVINTFTTAFNGTVQVTRVDANTFTYTCVGACSGIAASGDVTKVPWTPGSNDQVTEPFYQWLNTRDTTNNILFETPKSQCDAVGTGPVCENYQFYNYGGTQQTGVGTPFTGSPSTNNGVGVGTRANRPTTCTTGVAYWATDQGEWDSTHAGNDGVLDQCTATNQWTDAWYVPYTYPHPLTVGGPAPVAPTLTSVSPNTGAAGTTVTPITLTGTNFAIGGTTVAVSGTGVTVGTVNVSSTTQLTTGFTIDCTATVGARNVTVTTVNGTSSAQTFTITTGGACGPTIGAVSPNVGVAGTTVNPVTITGTNFVAPATVSVSGGGVAVGTVTVNSTTQLTTSFTISAAATPGVQNVTVTTSAGTSNASTFTINPPAPTQSAVSPNSGAVGTTVTPVTITGTNFLAPATVSVSGTGITVGAVSVNSPTLITTSFTIDPAAIVGNRNVTVTTVGGTSGAQTFTISAAPPTAANVSPNSGVVGTTVTPVTITGTNFAAGATVSVSGTGVTVGTVTVNTGTQLTTSFTISPTATLGARNLTVTTAAGTSNPIAFTLIAPPPPTLTGIAPTSGAAGTTVTPVTLTGTNFLTGATSVAISGTGVTVGTVTVNSATQLTTSFTIAAGATLGDQTVTVTTSGGTSNPVTFTVNPPAPTLTSVSPVGGLTGTTAPVTLTGTNFVAGATVAVSGTGVTVGAVTVNSATQLTTSFIIDSAATLGARNVTVTTAGGTSSPLTFTINAAAPTLTTVSPNTGVGGTTVTPVTLTGTNFAAGATVAVSGTGVTVGAVNVTSGTQLTTSFVIDCDATAGSRSVTVTALSGTSNAQLFTVTAPLTPCLPTLTGIVPSSGAAGATVSSVTLFGTNFISGATTVAVSGAGVAVGAVTVNSSTQLTTSVTIDAAATIGARNVTVTTGGGTSNPLGFAITATPTPNPPTLTSISPNSGVVGTTVGSLTLTGTNFVPSATVAVSGTGVTVGNLNVTSPTQLITSFTIDPSATTGSRNVTVTTADGTSSAVTFTINAAVTSTYSISANGLALFDVMSTVSPAYVVVQPDSGAGLTGQSASIPESQTNDGTAFQASGITGAPTGVAIIGGRNKSANVLVTEAGVPASSGITAGRIYAEMQGVTDTGLALANNGSAPATINFYFTDQNGNTVRSGRMTLAGGEQTAAFLDENLFGGPRPLLGTFTFESDQPLTAIALRGFTNERLPINSGPDFLLTTLAVAQLGSTDSSAILPHFAQGGGWTTQLVLVNTARDAAQRVNLEFFGPGVPSGNGQPGQPGPFLGAIINQTIPQNGMVRLDVPTFNPPVPVGSVKITPILDGTVAYAPAAFAIFSFQRDTVTVTQGSVLAQNPGLTFKMYLESSGGGARIGSVRSGVAIANPSSIEVTATLELMNFDGTSLGLSPAQINIPATGQLVKFIDEIPFNQPLPAGFQGIGRLTVSSPVAVATLRGRYNERGDFLITTVPPLNNDGVASPNFVVFPHLVYQDGVVAYSTQIILFGQGGTGKLFLYSQQGNLDTNTTSLRRIH